MKWDAKFFVNEKSPLYSLQFHSFVKNVKVEYARCHCAFDACICRILHVFITILF